jgi:hypothetical protein
MATARNTQRSSNSSQRSSSARGSQASRTTSRTGAWEKVKQHPIIATAGVLAMGVGAYALLRKNGGNGRHGRND